MHAEPPSSDHPPTEASSASTTRTTGKRLLPAAILIVAGLALYLSPLRDFLTFSSLVSHQEVIFGFLDAHFVWAWMLFSALYAVVVALSLPVGVFLTVFGGLMFGWFAGSLGTVIGATAGACTIFLVARHALADMLRARAGPWLEKFSDGLNKDAWSYLFFLRMMPIFPFWLVNIAPAFFSVKLRTYAITTFLGIMPGTVAYTLAGSGLREVLDQQADALRACEAAGTPADACTGDILGALVSPQVIIALGALGLVALLPVAYRRYRARNPGSAQTET